MHDDEKRMSIGEIGRTLARLEESQRQQTEKLEEIRSQTTTFVGRHEERLNGIDREIRDLKLARHPFVSSVSNARVTDRGDAIAINIPVNTKTIVALLLALAAIVAGLFGSKVPL